MDQARTLLLDRLIRPLGTGIPPGYDITVYVHDREQDLLSPIYPGWSRPGDDPRVFAPGDGATGQAFARLRDRIDPPGAVFVVTGEAVSDDTWNLSPEQRELWHDYRVVASSPFVVAGVPVGVITAISKIDDGFFGKQDGNSKLVLLANDIASLMQFTDQG